MGGLGKYDQNTVELTLHRMGIQPNWTEKANGHLQINMSLGKKYVINYWTTTGTVMMQGGGSNLLIESWRSTLPQVMELSQAQRSDQLQSFRDNQGGQNRHPSPPVGHTTVPARETPAPIGGHTATLHPRQPPHPPLTGYATPSRHTPAPRGAHVVASSTNACQAVAGGRTHEQKRLPNGSNSGMASGRTSDSDNVRGQAHNKVNDPMQPHKGGMQATHAAPHCSVDPRMRPAEIRTHNNTPLDTSAIKSVKQEGLDLDDNESDMWGVSKPITRAHVGHVATSSSCSTTAPQPGRNPRLKEEPGIPYRVKKEPGSNAGGHAHAGVAGGHASSSNAGASGSSNHYGGRPVKRELDANDSNDALGSHNKRVKIEQQKGPQMGVIPSKKSTAVNLKMYVDGSCFGNQSGRGCKKPAGWGVHITGNGFTTDLYGPVVLEASNKFFLGAENETNNTAELTAFCEAFLWLFDAPVTVQKATICYDSEYAHGVVTGKMRAAKNIDLVENGKRILKEAKKIVLGGIDFIHVKGHSGDPGNEKADELAKRGGAGQVCEIGRYANIKQEVPSNPYGSPPLQNDVPPIGSAEMSIAHGRGRKSKDPGVIKSAAAKKTSVSNPAGGKLCKCGSTTKMNICKSNANGNRGRRFYVCTKENGKCNGQWIGWVPENAA